MLLSTLPIALFAFAAVLVLFSLADSALRWKNALRMVRAEMAGLPQRERLAAAVYTQTSRKRARPRAPIAGIGKSTLNPPRIAFAA